MTVSQALADWVAQYPKSFSADARQLARDAILDIIACMFAGAEDEGYQRLKRAIAVYGRGESSVMGVGHGMAAPWAALANGMAAHCLDFDDNFIPALSHATAVSVPALLALAEQCGASGKEVVDAYIVGLEIQSVVGRGVNRLHYDKGWHATATVGCIGTAAACAHLLKLNRDQVANAISLGVSMASGAKVQFGTMAKPFQAGMAAKNAVLAAQLAAHDLEARACALEGPSGFLKLYAGDEAPGWDAILPDLGRRTAIEEFGLMTKLYPCCGSAHRILDTVLELRQRHRFEAEEVERIDAVVELGNQRNLLYTDPQNEMEARFSLNYCVAVALRQGQLRLEDFTARSIQRPEIRSLLPLTHMSCFPADANKGNPTVRLAHKTTIRLKSGQVLEGECAWPRGTIRNPLNEKEYADKFRDCCDKALTGDKIETLLNLLMNIESVEDIGQLTAYFRFSPISRPLHTGNPRSPA